MNFLSKIMGSDPLGQWLVSANIITPILQQSNKIKPKFAIQTLWTSLGWDGGRFGGGKGFFGVEHDRGLRYQRSVVAIVSSAMNAL